MDIDLTDWKAMVGAGAAAGTVLTKLWVKWSDLRIKRDEVRSAKAARDTFHATGDMVECLHRLMRSMGSSRALLLKAHNGGGDIDNKSPVYVSILQEIIDDDPNRLPRVMELWDKRKIDTAYWLVLRDLSDKKQIHLKTEELEAGSMLRQSYEQQGVRQAVVFEVFATGSAYFYCSLSIASDNEFSIEGRQGALRDAAYLVEKALHSVI